MATQDKYDVQIERLTADPSLIRAEWVRGDGLFAYAGPRDRDLRNFTCGCLTMIRAHDFKKVVGPSGPLDDISDEIRADERLPKSCAEITVESLPAFAEWQRKLDAMGIR